jgi:hypothetical protein
MITPAQRDDDILWLRSRGRTQGQIAARYRVTKPRIGQIEARARRRQQLSLERFGVWLDPVRRLQPDILGRNPDHPWEHRYLNGHCWGCIADQRWIKVLKERLEVSNDQSE